MKEFVSVNTHDLLVKNGRVWRVVGVYLGAVGYESVVEVEPVDRMVSKPSLPIQLPIDMIDRQDVFRAVDHESAKRGNVVSMTA